MKLQYWLVVASVALAVPAFAQDEGADKPKKKDPAVTFKKLDKDGDGMLTTEEFSAGKPDATKAAKAFKKRDTNADGKLTLVEFSTAPKKQPAKPAKPAEPAGEE
jgi:Ca2+-binding EF-hand superfamily protein